MDRDAALRTLGVDATTTPEEVRKRYLALLRQHHPDVAGGVSDVDVSLVTEAYRVVVAGDPLLVVEPPAAARPAVDVVAAGDTIAVELPPDEAFFALLDVASDVGTVTYVDPEAGLLEIQLTLADDTRWSMVCSLQGRATGTTDVFCTLAPLDRGARRGPQPLEALVGEFAALLAGSLNC